MRFRLGDIVGIKENKFIVQSVNMCDGEIPRYEISNGDYNLWFSENEIELSHPEKVGKTMRIIDNIMSVYGLKFGQKFSGVGMQGYAYFADDYSLNLEKIDDYKRVMNVLIFHPSEVEIEPEPLKFKVGDKVETISEPLKGEVWEITNIDRRRPNPYVVERTYFLDDGVEIHSYGNFPESELRLVDKKCGK